MNYREIELQKLRDEYHLVQERLNIALSAGKLAWWEMDVPSGKVIINEHKALMLGYDPADFKDCHYTAFTDLIHPEDFEMAMTAMADHLRGKKEIYQVTYRIKAKDGSYKWFYDRGSITIRNQEGRPLKVKGIVFDDSERIEAVKALEKSEKELKLSNATKDKFFSILSHDLRNPFSVIMGMADLLKLHYDHFSKEQLLEIYERIRSTSENAYKLMEDLLAWSRSQVGRMSFNPEALNLNELISEAIEPYRESADNKNLQCQIEVDQSLILYGDKYMLKTIIRNLFSNAVKFTNRGGKIIITASEANSRMIISVADEGVGMDQEKINNLFSIDKEISSKGTEDESGTGLGLVLCKEFADRHDGKIVVESAKGKGSKFTLLLPK